LINTLFIETSKLLQATYYVQLTGNVTQGHM